MTNKGGAMKKIIFGLVILSMSSFLTSFGMAQELKAIKLIYSNNAPAKAGGNIFFEKVWIPKINKELERSGYKLEFTNYHASSLYKYKDQVNACEKGLIDATNFIVSWEEARAPLHMVLNLPMMGFTAHSSTDIWFDLQDSIPEFGDEFSKYVELFHFSTAPYVFNMNEIRRVPADFKGIKVNATGVMADFFKSIGASPLRIDAPDWYSSMDRGLIDVLPLGSFIVSMWKLHEVAKVHVIPTGDALSWTCLSYIMNRKKFEQFPSEVQKVIKDNVRWASTEITEIDEGNRIRSEKMFEEIGNKVIRLNPEEIKLWRTAAMPAHEKWIKEITDKGLPGRKVYEETKQLIRKYSK
jgi:TRAP-type C4-dicarboxylate transport system substrate-binding protein